MWIGPRPDGEHRRLAPVDRHMGYSGRHIEVVTYVRDLSLLDSRMLNGVLIMVLVTSILGPVLTQRFAPRMLEPAPDRPA